MSSILDDNYREFDFEDSGESESNQSDNNSCVIILDNNFCVIHYKMEFL